MAQNSLWHLCFDGLIRDASLFILVDGKTILYLTNAQLLSNLL